MYPPPAPVQASQRNAEDSKQDLPFPLVSSCVPNNTPALVPSGTLTTQGDEVDLELNLMKQRMLTMLKFGGSVPSLVDLTKAAHDRILIDTKKTASYAVDPAISTSSFLSGVLIHGPEYTHYFWPASFEVVSPSGVTDMSEELAEMDASTYSKEMGSYVTARNAMNAVKDLLQSVRASNM